MTAKMEQILRDAQQKREVAESSCVAGAAAVAAQEAERREVERNELLKAIDRSRNLL